MKLKYKTFITTIIITFLVLLTSFWGEFVSARVDSTAVSTNHIQKINNFVNEQMRLGKIPGASVVIVSRERVYKKGFGFADLKSKRLVTPYTHFELGSTSKAFTALGVLRLKEQGLINGNDDIRMYLPWLKMKYVPKTAEPSIRYLNQNRIIRRTFPWIQKRLVASISIDQLLRHTSGIPRETIADIPIGRDAQALERTVRMLIGRELDYPPGERYNYATINYDILALIIQKVTGQTFETYMRTNVLNVLGLNHTYLSRQEVVDHDMATGYKIGFLEPHAYDAPIYRGNVAAGYFITNGVDMSKWLELQLKLKKSYFNRCIEKSHLDDYAYSYGWNIYRTNNRDEIVWHEGGNPNFSSYIEFRPEELLGVAVMANINTGYSQAIGKGIMYLLSGKGRFTEASFDMYQEIDKINVLLLIGLIFLLATTIVSTKKRYQIYKTFIGLNHKNITECIIGLSLLILLLIIIFLTPYIVFGFPWHFVLVWGPTSFPFVISLLIIEGITIYLYFFNCKFYRGNKKKRKPEVGWRNIFK